MAAPPTPSGGDYGDATASSGDEAFGALTPVGGGAGGDGAGAPTAGGVFRSKVGGIGDVLESNADADAG